MQLDRSGRTLRMIGEPDTYGAPALSPDGTRLAITRQDPDSEENAIWIWDLEREVRSRFTFERSYWAAAWSPDGSKLAFSGDGIHQKSTTGTGVRELIVAPSHAIWPLNWTSEDRIFFGSYRSNTGFDAGYVSIDAADSLRFVAAESFHEYDARGSRDGRYMAYATDETGTAEVYLRALGPEGGKWQVSTNGGHEPHWRADGRELFYLGGNRSLMAVPVEEDVNGQKPRLGRPELLFNAAVQRGMTRNRFVPATDGQSFYCLLVAGRDRVPPTRVILNW